MGGPGRRGAGLIAVAVMAGGLTACGSTTVTTAATIRPKASVGACGSRVSGPGAGPGAEPGPGADAGVVTSLNGFGFDLLDRLEAAAPNQNQAVSGSSVMTNLAMLAQGARGTTAAQIVHTLHSNQTPAELAGSLRNLAADLAADAAAGGVSLEQTNTVWAQNGLALEPAFAATLAKDFAAPVRRAPLATDPSAATRAINAAVSAQTCGQITKLLPPGMIDPTTIVILVNALYFHGQWLQQFSAGATKPGPFSPDAGAPTVVSFMHQDLAAQVSVSPTMQAVQLPYVGRRFAAVAVMPIGSTLASLNPASVEAAIAGLRSPSKVNLALPRFSLSSEHNLAFTLSAMGMPQAFGPSANLSGISPAAASVKFVQHQAKVTVNEAGTTAAAATAGGIESSAVEVPVNVTFNHPFLFLIRDLRTGAIVFSAAVQRPS